MDLFKNEGRCILCHNGKNFTDNKLHDSGVLDNPGQYKTPTLRNLFETRPYMHNGWDFSPDTAMKQHIALLKEKNDLNVDITDEDEKPLLLFLYALGDESDPAIVIPVPPCRY